jgi:hypothetical protein
MTEYPLKQLLQIKIKRFEMAEKLLHEKKEELIKQEKILKEKEKDRNQVLKHKEDKLQQLRDALDRGERSDKIQQMKIYMETVKERLLVEEKKVSDQKKNVKKAEEDVEKAKRNLIEKEKDLEKLKMHKTEWTKEELKLFEIEEEKVLDEMGSNRFHPQKRKKNL